MQVRLSSSTTPMPIIDLVKIIIDSKTTIYVRPSKDLEKVKQLYKGLLKREKYPPRKLDEIVRISIINQ